MSGVDCPLFAVPFRLFRNLPMLRIITFTVAISLVSGFCPATLSGLGNGPRTRSYGRCRAVISMAQDSLPTTRKAFLREGAAIAAATVIGARTFSPSLASAADGAPAKEIAVMKTTAGQMTFEFWPEVRIRSCNSICLCEFFTSGRGE